MCILLNLEKKIKNKNCIIITTQQAKSRLNFIKRIVKRFEHNLVFTQILIDAQFYAHFRSSNNAHAIIFFFSAKLFQEMFKDLKVRSHKFSFKNRKWSSATSGTFEMERPYLARMTIFFVPNGRYQMLQFFPEHLALQIRPNTVPGLQEAKDETERKTFVWPSFASCSLGVVLCRILTSLFVSRPCMALQLLTIVVRYFLRFKHFLR